MTQDANPGSEDCDPPDEDGSQQSRRIAPTPEDDDPPVEDSGLQPRQIEPGPQDDDPPPQKRPQVNSFFRSLRHMLARFFYHP